MSRRKIKVWTMPAWMETYCDFIQNTGGLSVEDLMNDRDTTASVYRACVSSVKDQVQLLEILHGMGLIR